MAFRRRGPIGRRPVVVGVRAGPSPLLAMGAVAAISSASRRSAPQPTQVVYAEPPPQQAQPQGQAPVIINNIVPDPNQNQNQNQNQDAYLQQQQGGGRGYEPAPAYYDPNQGYMPSPDMMSRGPDKHFSVMVGNTTLAQGMESDLIKVEGNWYFPQQNLVHRERYLPSDTRTTCPWKGVAAYYHYQTPDGQLIRDAAWYYPSPKKGAEMVANRVAFYIGKQGLKIES